MAELSSINIQVFDLLLYLPLIFCCFNDTMALIESLPAPSPPPKKKTDEEEEE